MYAETKYRKISNLIHMELNKEDFEQILDKKFDEKLAGFATKDDLKAFATKTDLDNAIDNAVKEMKAFTEGQVEKLALNIQETIAIPLEELRQLHKDQIRV